MLNLFFVFCIDGFTISSPWFLLSCMSGVEFDNDEDHLLVVMRMLGPSICFFFAGAHEFILPWIYPKDLFLVLDLALWIDFWLRYIKSNSLHYAIHIERCVYTLKHSNSESTLTVDSIIIDFCSFYFCLNLCYPFVVIRMVLPY